MFQFNKFVLVLFFSIFSGCSFFQSNDLKPTSLKKINKSFDLDVVWKKNVGKIINKKSNSGSFTPKIYKDKVITSTSNGLVSILNINNGEIYKKIPLGLNLLSSASYSELEEKAFLSAVTESGELIFFQVDKGFIWKVRLDGISRVSPEINGSIITVKYTNNKIYGYDFDTGKMMWNINRRTPSLVLHGQSGMTSFASSNNYLSKENFKSHLAVNFTGGRAMMIDSRTGSLEWESRVAYPKGVNEVERIIDLIGQPTIEDEEVCSTVYQTKLICLNLQDGTINWSQNFKAIKPAVFTSPYVVALNFNDELVAFDRVSEKKIWENNDLLFRYLSAPKIWNNFVWVSDFEGKLHGLSLENGQIEARLNLGSGKLAGDLLVAETGILVQKENGNLFLIRNQR